MQDNFVYYSIDESGRLSLLDKDGSPISGVVDLTVSRDMDSVDRITVTLIAGNHVSPKKQDE